MAKHDVHDRREAMQELLGLRADVQRMMDAAFWRLITRRRDQGETIPSVEVLKAAGLPPAPSPRRRG